MDSRHRGSTVATAFSPNNYRCIESVSPTGHQSRFDFHRLTNPSAWLDREERLRARKAGKPLGYGFAEPKPAPPKQPDKPFYVMEPAFTSGLMVMRKYNHVDVCGYKTEDERSDPYHYPNFMEVKESEFAKDARRRSSNVDPRQWKPDPKMAHIVTDDIVQSKLAGELGETRTYPDPEMMATLFDDNLRLQPNKLNELNADLSCLDLPGQEGGTVAERARQRSHAAAVRQGQAVVKTGNDWSWCMGGRKPQPDQRQLDPIEAKIVKSQSVPQMSLSRQPSFLHGNLGGDATSSFHGLNTRQFGNNDLRMRGGTAARSGWAGTFPENETKRQ